MATALAYMDNYHFGARRPWVNLNYSGYTTTTSVVQQIPRSGAATTDQASSFDTSVEVIWMKPTVDRLNHLLLLQDGWDGPGAKAVPPIVAMKALDTLSQIAVPDTRPPSISPGRDGTLQLAWYARDFELEIDIPHTGNPAVSLYNRNTDAELDLTLRSPELVAALKRLAAG